MSKVTHQEFIEKLKTSEILSLLYCLVEAKAGRHIDIVADIPLDVIQQAETGLNQLIRYSRTLQPQDH